MSGGFFCLFFKYRAIVLLRIPNLPPSLHFFYKEELYDSFVWLGEEERLLIVPGKVHELRCELNLVLRHAQRWSDTVNLNLEPAACKLRLAETLEMTPGLALATRPICPDWCYQLTQYIVFVWFEEKLMWKPTASVFTAGFALKYF